MASSNLAIPDVTTNQSGKADRINQNFERVDNSINTPLAVTISGNRLLTQDEVSDAGIFDLTGSPGAGFDFEIPAINRRFIVRNNTGFTATVQVDGGGGAGATVLDTEIKEVICDGTDCFLVG
jgi:hypothetical protein